MRRLLNRVRAWFHRSHDADLAEEIDLHRSLARQQLEADCLDPEAADRVSRRLVGNITLAREDARAVWVWPWLESVWQDAVYAFRSLRRQPGFTLTVVVTLGVGIGLNTSLATLCGAMLWQPWRVAPAADVREVFAQRLNGSNTELNLGDYQLLAGRATSGAVLATGCGVDGRQESCLIELNGERAVGHFVSGNYFDVLAIPMARGRGFTRDEDRFESPVSVAVISHELWQRRFNGRSDILTTPIDLDGARFDVVGVTAESFSGVTLLRRDVWVPLASARVLRPSNRPGQYGLDVAIRLRQGVSDERAGAELEVLLATLPPEPRRVRVVATSSFGRPSDRREGIAFFSIGLAALLLVLLIACANAGNLLLARTVARAREIAVRASIGASRARIVRQLLTESLVLASLAALVGIWLATILPGLVMDRGFQSSDVAGRLAYTVGPDWRVVAFTVGLAAFTCLAFGLAPAVHASRAEIVGGLKDRTGGLASRLPLRAWLLGAQVAIGVVLLSSAALLVRGMQHASVVDFGFDVAGVTLTRLDLPASYDTARKKAFANALIEKVRESPAPDNLALTSVAPLEDGLGAFVRLPDTPIEASFRVNAIDVTPGYFSVLGLSVVAGRPIGRDDAGRHTVVVNEAMARRAWPGANAIGRAIFVESNGKEVAHEVVGVIRDADTFGRTLNGGSVGWIVYEHLAAAPDLSGTLPIDPMRVPRILTRGHGADFSRMLIELGMRLEPRARMTEMPLTRALNQRLSEARLITWLGGGVGLVALVLAMVGVFGVFGYFVRQQSREIGVRIALGARSSEVVRGVLRLGARPLLIGAVLGLASAVGVGFLLRSSLYGLSPIDPIAYLGVLAVLVTASVFSLALPAWRATRVNPVIALRSE
jgi:predicted permease